MGGARKPASWESGVTPECSGRERWRAIRGPLAELGGGTRQGRGGARPVTARRGRRTAVRARRRRDRAGRHRTPWRERGAMTDPGGSSACRAAPVCASRVPSGSRERADPPMPVGGYGDARRVLAGTFRSMTSGRLSESRSDTRGASGVRGAAGRGRTLAARPAGLPRRAARPHPGHGVPVAAGAQPRPSEAAPRGRGAASVRRDMGSGLRFSRYGRPCAVRQHVLTPAGLRRRAAAAAASPRAATGARRRVHGRVRVPAGGGMGNGAGPRRDRWGKGPHPR